MKTTEKERTRRVILTTLLILILVTVGFSQETITIGTQTWMKQNLNVGIAGTDKDCYNNLLVNCTIYGGLYLWDQLLITNEGDQGICPTGFHIPTKAEYRELDMYLGGSINPDGTTSLSGTAGQKLKESGYLHWMRAPVASGTDEVGFTMLPSGYKYGTGYSALKSAGYFWTSTSMHNNEGAWMRVTSFYKANLGEYAVWKYDNPGGKASKLPVRCIKNQAK
jgi:uncharacterized protein (TIGR02145 family)